MIEILVKISDQKSNFMSNIEILVKNQALKMSNI